MTLVKRRGGLENIENAPILYEHLDLGDKLMLLRHGPTHEQIPIVVLLPVRHLTAKVVRHVRRPRKGGVLGG